MYMAPELLALSKYKGEDIDLFALAVILFTLLAGFHPFNKAQNNDLSYRKLIQNDAKAFWNLQTKKLKSETAFSENLKDLLTKMLSAQPSQRLNIDEVIAHPWTQDNLPNQDEVHQYMKHRETRIPQPN